MLVIRVEVWPGGDQAGASEIARIGVANVTRLAPVSNYSVVMTEGGKVTAKTVINSHSRSLGWLRLVWRAMLGLYNPEMYQEQVPNEDTIIKRLTEVNNEQHRGTPA